MTNVKRIASYGGGVNSTAMLIGLTKKGVKLDYILFADTGGEKPETYAFVKVFSDWLVANGQPAITTVRTTNRNGEVITLEQEMLTNGTIPPIAFGFKSCSEKFKQRPQEKFLTAEIGRKKQGEKNAAITNLFFKYIGFDAGERRRAKPDPTGKYNNVFPLIEWGWNRNQCLQEIQKEGLPIPPKSSCFFCPNMTKNEILALSEDLQDRAIIMENNAKNKLMELKGLGRRFSWFDVIRGDKTQFKIFDDDVYYEIPCECID